MVGEKTLTLPSSIVMVDTWPSCSNVTGLVMVPPLRRAPYCGMSVPKHCSTKGAWASTSRAIPGGQSVPRVKQRTPELRARLLVAAMEVLSEEGALGLTARAVADPGPNLGPGALRALRGQVRPGPRAVLRGLSPPFGRAGGARRPDGPRGRPMGPGRGVPPFRAGQPVPGRGHVLAAHSRLLPRVPRTLNSPPDRCARAGGGPGPAVHRSRPAAGRRDRRGARVRRPGPRHGVRRGSRAIGHVRPSRWSGVGGSPWAACSTGSVLGPCQGDPPQGAARSRAPPRSGVANSRQESSGAHPEREVIAEGSSDGPATGPGCPCLGSRGLARRM